MIVYLIYIKIWGESMKNKIIIILFFTIITVSLTNYKNISAQYTGKTTLTEYKELKHDTDLETNYKILFTSEAPIDLTKNSSVNLTLQLNDNELNTDYSLIICCLKAEDNLNKDSIISLAESLNNKSNYNNTDYYNNLSYKALDIKTFLTTTFDINSDGSYIFFVLDKDNLIDASKLEVSFQYTINIENDEGVLPL